MFNYFSNIISSKFVKGSIKPEEFLHNIKCGETHTKDIIKVREIYNFDQEGYNEFKLSKLPCYSLNFTFNETRSNDTIIEPTGYIYIDVDGKLDIDLSNPLIYASWISLSATGRGILVKVDGLNKTNFSSTYNEISNKLNIKSDEGARKPTQVNVLSFDPELYVNNYSFTYLASEKKDHNSNIKKEKRTIETVLVSKYHNLRFDNLDELVENIEFNGDVIYDFNEKIKYADAYIHYGGYHKGERNNGLCGYAYQLRALNPSIEFNTLYNLLKKVNEAHCSPPLQTYEIRGIAKGVMNTKNIEQILNKERRFVYNPDYKLTTTEKRSETMKVINKERIMNSKKKIEETIKNWDFDTMGKITQKGIQSITKQSLNTIKKYYSLFKSDIQSLNTEFSKKKN